MPRYFFRLEKSTVSAIPRAFQLALASLAATTGVKSAAYSMGRWRFTELLGLGEGGLTLSLRGCSVRNSLPSKSLSKEALMLRRAIWALVVTVCLAAPMAVHAQGDYLDVYIVKVKPEKLADFQTLTKKWIDANRKYNGDTWIAMETVYGEGNVYQFTSIRKDYTDIDKVNEAAMAAANKAFGKEMAEKMERDCQNCLVLSRSELRRRRWDLSRNVPMDAAAYAKFIG